jgi:hypothetical protein
MKTQSWSLTLSRQIVGHLVSCCDAVWLMFQRTGSHPWYSAQHRRTRCRSGQYLFQGLAAELMQPCNVTAKTTRQGSSYWRARSSASQRSATLTQPLCTVQHIMCSALCTAVVHLLVERHTVLVAAGTCWCVKYSSAHHVPRDHLSACSTQWVATSVAQTFWLVCTWMCSRPCGPGTCGLGKQLW